jgi:hypothetical protein
MQSLLPRIFFCVIATALTLSGCVSAPHSAKLFNREKIEETNKVEVFYNPEEHVVIHDFGIQSHNLMGLTGLLGPVGALVAAGASALATKSALDQAVPRSQSFNKAVASEVASLDMDDEVAQHLAERLESMGKIVKITRVSRLAGSKPGLTIEQPYAHPELATTGFTPTPGYTPLLLRMTTGYGSPDALTDFRSVAIIEYALVDPNSHRYLVEGKLESIDTPAGPTYFTWLALLQDVSVARSQIRRSLMHTGESVPALIFAFDGS